MSKFEEVVELVREKAFEKASDLARSYPRDYMAMGYVSSHSKSEWGLADEETRLVAELAHSWQSDPDDWGFSGELLIEPGEEIFFVWDEEYQVYEAYREEDGERFKCSDDSFLPIDLNIEEGFNADITVKAVEAYREEDFEAFWELAETYISTHNSFYPDGFLNNLTLVSAFDTQEEGVVVIESAETLYLQRPPLFEGTEDAADDFLEKAGHTAVIDPITISRAYALLVEVVDDWEEEHVEMDFLDMLYQSYLCDFSDVLERAYENERSDDE